MLKHFKVNSSHLFVQGYSTTRYILHRLLQADVSQGRHYRQWKYTPTQKKVVEFCRHF